jgi:hypothetical protein
MAQVEELAGYTKPTTAKALLDLGPYRQIVRGFQPGRYYKLTPDEDERNRQLKRRITQAAKAEGITIKHQDFLDPDRQAEESEEEKARRPIVVWIHEPRARDESQPRRGRPRRQAQAEQA